MIQIQCLLNLKLNETFLYLLKKTVAMDKPNFRKKPALRPVTRKVNHDSLGSSPDHNFNYTKNLKRVPNFQISIIPSAYCYHDQKAYSSYQQALQNQNSRVKMFDNKMPIPITFPFEQKSDKLQQFQPLNLIKHRTSMTNYHPSNNQRNSKKSMNSAQRQQDSDELKNDIDQILGALKFDEAKDADRLMLGKIQKLLGYYQSKAISETLKKLLSKELLLDQAKIYICSQCLIATLIIIKSFKENTKETSNPFEMMNNMNKGILQYLMSKYPRSKNLFVEYQLESKFDKISFTSLFQFNMLVNCRYTFTQNGATRTQILNKTKAFINILLNQLDSKFSIFNSILNNKIFKLEGMIDLKLNKIKIGRKIPQNTQKFYEFDTEVMEVHSPQLFRVMIKWIQSMQRLLTNPSDIINKIFSMQYIKKNLGAGQIIFDNIQSKRFEQMKIEIIEKITAETKWKEEVSQLLEKLNTFNNNLTNTLKVRSPKTKFIRQEQAETLKFAKFNTLFLEWLIVEKFLILIDTLSNLSTYFQTRYFKKLDFINFKVFDLMRASFSGKKNQILEVFGNLHKLQEDGILSIVRVKNRLNTPLNDVLINFKLKESFLICQLQLVLVENLKEGEDKLKMMESLNHIIYELERSPYGSLSQMALIVGYYDPTILYEKKIKFENDWYTDEICKNGNRHQFIQNNDLTTPFVCSWCVNFYGRGENFFEYHQCINCLLQKCKACVFAQDPIQQKRVYYKYFASCFLNISLQQIQNDKDDDFIDNFFIRDQTNFISEKYIKIREFLQIEGKNSKIQQIQGILHTKQKQYGLKATQPFYCLLLRLQQGKHNLKVIKYENYKIEICTQDKQLKKKIRIQKHDALFLFRKRVFHNPKDDKHPHIGISSSQNKDMRNMKNIVDGNNIKIKKKGYNVIYLRDNRQSYLLDLIKISNIHSDQNSEKIARVLGNIVNRCQSYQAQRSCMQLQGLGVNLPQLTPITSKKWVNSIMVLNLSNNRINAFAQIFKHFKNLQELYLCHNLIQKLEIEQEIHTLKVLDVSDNLLTQISESLNKFRRLLIFRAHANRIKKIAILNLSELEEIRLNDNNLDQMKNLAESLLPDLEILSISNNKLSKDNKFDLKILKKFTNLRKIEAQSLNIKVDKGQALGLNFLHKLESLQLSNNEISNIDKLTQKRIRQIRMVKCNLTNLTGIFTDKLIHLEILHLEDNQISQLPVLDLPELLTIILSNNKMKSIENIQKCFLPKLQTLQLQSNGLQQIQELGKAQLPQLNKLLLHFNRISNIPILKFPKLQMLNLMKNKLVNIDNFSFSELPRLKRLLIRNNQIIQLPSLYLPQLQEVNPCQNKISNFENFKQSFVPKLNKLTLWKNKITQMPTLKFNQIQELLLFENQITDISGISKSNLDSVKILSLYLNQIKELPVLSLKNLQKFYAYRNNLSNINALSEWKVPKLQVLDLNHNEIVNLPTISMNSLNELEISQNLIEDLTQFSQSALPNLRKLFINKNPSLKVLCKLQNLKKIEQIQLNFCSLTNFNPLAECDFKYLKKLSFEGNQITEMPNIKNLQSLEELNVRDNKITQLKHRYNENKKLSRIWMTRNCIKMLQSEIFENSCVKQISLSRNPLLKIQLPQNLKLKSLTLISCKITSLSGFYAPKLSELFLKDNLLENIDFLNKPGSFSSLNKVILQKNLIKTIPSLDLPRLAQISFLGNPVESIDDILYSNLPNLKRIFILKSAPKTFQKIKLTTSKEVNQKEDNKNIIEEESSGSDKDQKDEEMSPLKKTEKQVPFETSIIRMIKSDDPKQARQKFLQRFIELFPNALIQI